MSSSIQPTTIPVAVYYVLPVNCGGDGLATETNEQTQACKYYVYDEKKQKYVHFGAKLLAVRSGLWIDYVVLQQLPSFAPVEPALQINQATKDVTLFSVTAKNLLAGNQVPNIFLAATAKVERDAMASVVIPVGHSEVRGITEVRGVILIFSVQDSNGNTLSLRSSSDPEILGSTN